MISKEDKGHIISIALYAVFIGIIIFAIFAFNYWGERHPVDFCDNLEQEYISKHNAKVCKLRYPILNAEEIKALKEENKKLENKNYDLEDKLDSIEIYLKDLESTITDIKKELKND